MPEERGIQSNNPGKKTAFSTTLPSQFQIRDIPIPVVVNHPGKWPYFKYFQAMSFFRQWIVPAVEFEYSELEITWSNVFFKHWINHWHYLFLEQINSNHWSLTIESKEQQVKQRLILPIYFQLYYIINHKSISTCTSITHWHIRHSTINPDVFGWSKDFLPMKTMGIHGSSVG